MPLTRQVYYWKQSTKLTLYEHEGILEVSGRASMEMDFGASFLPKLTVDSGVAELLISGALTRDHGRRDTTLATTNQVTWIVKRSRLAELVFLAPSQ